mmetsp:Transcript_21198/g.50243  ORF Transcript_21198/g.50243 Transcript_21198/m.50243 type:complete len:262 (+) Transcript_21198:120-905(+)
MCTVALKTRPLRSRHVLVLKVDGLIVGRHRRLLEGLAHRGVGVARARDVLGGRAVLDPEHALGDHLARVVRDDVHAEDLVRLRLGHELDEPVRQRVCARARVGHERELADLVLDARRLCLILRHANVGHLREGVDHAGDRLVVDVAVLARDVFNDGDALLLRLVRQHRSADHVTDGPDARHVGLHALVHLHDAARAHFDTRLLKTQPVCVCVAPDRDENNVGGQRLLLAVLDRFDGQRDTLSLALSPDHLGLHLELHALLG